MHHSRRVFLTGLAASAAFGSRLGAGERRSSREVSWLDEVQRPPQKLPDATVELPPLLVDADGEPIKTREAWMKRRGEIRRRWEAFLHPLSLERPQPKLVVLEEDYPVGCVRQRVRYESEPGLPVEGYLLRPAKLERPAPGVVALHPTTTRTIRLTAGVEGDPVHAHALKLAQRGMVTFCPRCFLWQGEGDYLEQVRKFKVRHPQSLGMAKMLWDAMRGVDLLTSLDEVDSQRLGAVGHSLGAKEALYLAAFDERIKATVSSEGGIGTQFSNWEAPWYLGDAIKTGKFTREHHELLALVAPRAFLLIGGDRADGDRSWPFIEAALSVYRMFDDQPARLGLFNHHQGHSIPPVAEERMYEWLTTYL
ncbi:alpha/beta hydrolase family protein [Lignipirellula cremea]|uniref:Acetyl xylan esterase (AXE1) n=1 Tax=Lignipirellula cremea TaxID=2528010 RepID=A0A518DKW4_9BACT|nr:acetylxylan esterase [Lignipirellula cremea]QDU92474.1 Acetyl xylan esterase (AXE1) [Lignipirellula cremea]